MERKYRRPENILVVRGFQDLLFIPVITKSELGPATYCPTALTYGVCNSQSMANIRRYDRLFKLLTTSTYEVISHAILTIVASIGLIEL